jgi:hypothetical protein
MNDELGFQNNWICAGIAIAAILLGSLVLNDASEGVQGLFGMGCLCGAIALRHLLDGRKLRRLEQERTDLPR